MSTGKSWWFWLWLCTKCGASERRHRDVPEAEATWNRVYCRFCGTLMTAFAPVKSVGPKASVDLVQLSARFQDRVAADKELRGEILGVEAARASPVSPSAIEVPVELRAWADKTRARRHRLVNKLGDHMLQALREFTPAPPRPVVNVALVDELQQQIGVIVLGGSSDSIEFLPSR